MIAQHAQMFFVLLLCAVAGGAWWLLQWAVRGLK